MSLSERTRSFSGCEFRKSLSSLSPLKSQWDYAATPSVDLDSFPGTNQRLNVITIRFPDHATEKRALGFLLGRFSGRVLRSGVHIVPESALEALADGGIEFVVKGKTTYEEQLAALRSPASAKV